MREEEGKGHCIPAEPLSDDTENEKDWTNHNVSMRRAFWYCQKLAETLPSQPVSPPLPNEFSTAARNLKQKRRQALIDFWGSNKEQVLPTIKTVSGVSPDEFKRHFLDANLPCLIRGLESHFDAASSKWTDIETGKIRRDWFQNRLGETLVPVRHQPADIDPGLLDADGRAVECETKNMPVQSWIDMVDDVNCDPSFYLKDWHLAAWLERNTSKCSTTGEEPQTLYKVPAIFPHDLLNGFLTRHTAGDYRFVYWGPAGSTTSLHSDVLNSYSWSYNVCGCKEWTFYPPLPPGDASATEISVSLVQRAGECVFVPAGWKHRVVNCEETLSINHNWITTSNLDLTLECLFTEMQAIEVELRSWGVSGYEAEENMLLGCVGLDVSFFFWMILSRTLELLQLAAVDSDREASFDLTRLGEMLSVLVDNTTLNLRERLAATLCGEKPAEWAVATAKYVLVLLNYLG